jgi:hypothetical protein
MEGSPLRSGAATPEIDEEEFEGWAEQCFPAVESTHPDRLPLPVMVSLLDSLAAYRDGSPAAFDTMPPVHPFHASAGAPAAHWQSMHRACHKSLFASRSQLARVRALAQRQPMQLSSAAASLKTVCSGSRDGGAFAALLAEMGFSSTLVSDENTHALMNFEQTLGQLVDAKLVAKSALRFRTSPFSPFPPAENAADAAAADSFHAHFDLAVWVPPVPPLLQSPLESGTAIEMQRFGTAGRPGALAFDAGVVERLRPTGGSVLVATSNTLGLGRSGVDDFGLGDAQDALKQWLPRCVRSCTNVRFEHRRGVSEAFDHELRLDRDATRRRLGMLGQPRGRAAEDAFSAAAALPDRVAEALSMASERAGYIVACFEVEPLASSRAAAALGRHEAGEQSPAPGRALQVSSHVPDVAAQGPVAFRDTFEYERYIPKDGRGLGKHWTSTLPDFGFLDEAAVAERRAAAERSRMRRSTGEAPQWPKDAEGQPLTPHANRAHVLADFRRGTPEDDPLTAALLEESKRKAGLDDAAAPLRSGNVAKASRLTSAEPVPIAQHLFSEAMRGRRRDFIRKKALRTPHGAAHYMDTTVKGSVEAQISKLDDLDRAVTAERGRLRGARRKSAARPSRSAGPAPE